VRRRNEGMERSGEEEIGSLGVPSTRSVQLVSRAGQTGNLEKAGRNDI
jgi:hypothetical protein